MAEVLRPPAYPIAELATQSTPSPVKAQDSIQTKDEIESFTAAQDVVKDLPDTKDYLRL